MAEDQPALRTSLRDDRIWVGERFSVSLQRTLRLPDDGRVYPLTPGLGAFPVARVADFADRVPSAWRERGGFFVPLYQREALWLQFEAADWKPNAVQVGVGSLNALTGEPWDGRLTANPQNYVVCPDQPWLDGIHTGDGTVRQFVAVGLGSGDTVEEQLAGAGLLGGLQLRVYEPRPGRFPDRPPRGGVTRFESLELEDAGMGIAAGGTMRQRIYPDLRGVEVWDQDVYGSAFIHLANTDQYRAITGREPPPTPITARTYTDLGLPWFVVYDEDRGDIPPAERLRAVRSLGERDAQRGGAPDEPIDLHPDQLIELRSNIPTEGEQE